MIGRRDLISGLFCFGAAGAANQLKPHRHVSLLAPAKLEDFVPHDFGDWIAKDVTDLVAPTEPGSLASRLYDQTLGRTYHKAIADSEVMMLLAHGDTQTNDRQLHRPESCYPAFGFAIPRSEVGSVTLAPGVSLPVRRLVATAADRQENILYWARLGEDLPTSLTEQRLDRLRTSMRGVIADGVLARFSLLGSDADASFNLLSDFIPAFIRAVPAARRASLIGSERAAALVGL